MDVSRRPSRAVVLRAPGVSRSFGGQTLLAGVDLQADARDRVGVIGCNGIGKSTLLRLLAGLDQPDDGVIERARVDLAAP